MPTNVRAAPSSRSLILVVMCVGYFLVLLDVTVINVALPQLGVDLDVSVSGLQWVVDAYALALAALLLAGGTAGDVFGHRRTVLAGLVLFGCGSLVCALAPGITTLVSGRACQGVGAALMLPGTLAVITRTFPRREEQATAVGVWASIGSIALPAGPLVGGLLVHGPGWRWVFWLNLPFVLVMGVVVARVTPEHRPDRTRRLDWAGAALMALALAALASGAIETGSGGLGPRPLVAWLVCAVALAGFVAVERRVDDPMLPLGLLRRPSFSAANAVAGCMNLGTLGLLFVLTLYLQSVQGRSALEAGVMVIPLFLPLVIGSPFVGRWTARVGPRQPVVVGLVVAAIGVALAVSWTARTAYVEILPALVLWGIGMAVLTPAVVAAAVGAVEPDRAGLASGINNASRQAGGLIGVAVAGAVAGPPAQTDSFVSGLHLTALLVAGIFLVAAVVSGLLIERGRPA